MYKTISTEVDVDVDLGDFETDDLVEELESRDHDFSGAGDGLLEQIWIRRRNGQNYDYLLDQMIYSRLGKIV